MCIKVSNWQLTGVIFRSKLKYLSISEYLDKQGAATEDKKPADNHQKIGLLLVICESSIRMNRSNMWSKLQEITI